TLYSSSYNLERVLREADVVISTVLIPGASAPKIITEKMVQGMPKGSIIIDIAIDQGGSVETITKPTTNEEPIMIKHGVLHYALTNMPGALPQTSTFALTNATINYILFLANNGLKACIDNKALYAGLNIVNGHIVHRALTKIYQQPSLEFEEVISLFDK
ncbi:MAG: alanine dehydrogenase, partial [Bacilli bacterium]